MSLVGHTECDEDDEFGRNAGDQQDSIKVPILEVQPDGVSDESLKVTDRHYSTSDLKFFFILLVLIFTGFFVVQKMATDARITEEARLQTMFADFLKKFPRAYKSSDERDYRYSVFKKNVHEYEEEEKKMDGVDFDLTDFADWTNFELRRLVFKPQSMENISQIVGLSRMEGSSLWPFVKRVEKVDWRSTGKVTHVKNQGSCGSCWAFATVAAIESRHAIVKGQTVSLSEQQLVDCDSRNHACRGGFRPYAMDFVKENGLVPENKYPYEGSQQDHCRISGLENTTRIFIDSYRILSRNEEYIADWVASTGPVSVGMTVTKPMYMYKSGIFDPTPEDCKEKSVGSHAVTIVGYDRTNDGKQYWIVKNSWGTSWGMNGYFHLARGVNSCGIANVPVAPVIT